MSQDQRQSIHIIITGGTIDSYYDPPTATSAVCSKSIIPEYINEKIKPYDEITYETVCMLDSKEITRDISDDIILAINQAKTNKVLVIHGTDTMSETACYLAENLNKTQKTIILTGAMIPLKEFVMSDGGFNLGYALAQVKNASAGVYVAMNATLFSADNVTKNTDIGRFEEK